MLVMLNLIFKLEQNHPDGHNIFGQVPHFAFDMGVGIKRLEQGSHDENRSPGKKAGDRNKRAGRGSLVGRPKVNAATEIDSKQDCIESEVGTIWPVLKEKQEYGQRAISAYQHHAQRMEEVPRAEQRNHERAGTDESSRGNKHRRVRGRANQQSEVERVAAKQRP